MSPSKINIIVAAVSEMKEPNGSTVGEIESYLKGTSQSISKKEVIMCVKRALEQSRIEKRGRGRYRVNVPLQQPIVDAGLFSATKTKPTETIPVEESGPKDKPLVACPSTSMDPPAQEPPATCQAQEKPQKAPSCKKPKPRCSKPKVKKCIKAKPKCKKIPKRKKNICNAEAYHIVASSLLLGFGRGCCNGNKKFRSFK